MDNNIKEQEVSKEENVNLGEGLNLDMPIGEEGESESGLSPAVGTPTPPDNGGDKDNFLGCRYLPSMKINCGLEVGIGSKNKVIYVCPGKLQYFTASALCCCGDETIEIEYCGKKHCEHGKIKGHLGYYKIVNSGIIFIPNRNLSEFPEYWYPTDILTFKAESKCDKDVKFDVVFTYSRCVDCGCGCDKNCRG